MFLKILFRKASLLILFLSLPLSSPEAGEVYLVIGSDTAIWDGMSVSRFHCHYNLDLYTDPAANASQMMDPAFRARFKDSYGQPLKMTWWMMAGNIFRHADNTDVPVPNIMTMYLMKKYHGESVKINGDELSLHYHTFYWSDYNGDGLYYWNQSLTFMECFDDFNLTLAQFLLDEQVFPVSFRSGWHYMDNDWQHYLDERVLPYSMHNDYPAKRTDTSEPLDNTYDWSLSPEEFIPFRPSTENYQIPGDGSGWNVRSASFQKTIAWNLVDAIFKAADAGKDQVACIWSHLPENDFLNNIEVIDSLVHQSAAAYTNVKFRYCTAVEAMKRWRQSTDDLAPQLSFQEISNGENVCFEIGTDEDIFQTQPFVAVKDVYENYRILSCTPAGKNLWQTESISKKGLAKAGVAVCDTLGNQSMKFLTYLPDDVFLDNLDDDYVEICGNWSTTTKRAWGVDSRMAILSGNDSAKAQWYYTIEQSCPYNLFIQVPEISNPADNILFSIYEDQELLDTLRFTSPIAARHWQYLTTVEASEGQQLTVEMKALGRGQPGKAVAADVLKISALVKERELYVQNETLDFGFVSAEDTASYTLELENHGVSDLNIQEIQSVNGLVYFDAHLPQSIPAMDKIDITLFLHSTQEGAIHDTLIIKSDDLREPQKKIAVLAQGLKYFRIIDNEDDGSYLEYGEWKTSVAQAYGASSRYAWLNADPLAWAQYSTKLKKSGVYEIFEIVPKTVNSADRALYEFRIQSVVVDSIYLDQNAGSGGWVSLGKQFIPAGIEVQLRIIDTGENNVGPVLRADAIKYQLIEEITDMDERLDEFLPKRFYLGQNYPNPFNDVTVIPFRLAQAGNVELTVYNMLGEKVATIISAKMAPGTYRHHWHANGLASGIYYFRFRAGKHFTQVRKMLYMK